VYFSGFNRYIFQPIPRHVEFMPCKRLTGTSGDMREMSYIFQRLSVIVQRFYSVLKRNSRLKKK